MENRASYCEETPEESAFLESLQDICRYICENGDGEPEDVLKFPLQSIVELTHAREANIRFPDADPRTMTGFSTGGGDRTSKPALSGGAGGEGPAYEKGRVCVSKNLNGNDVGRLPGSVLHEGISLSVPLVSGGREMGVLNACYPRPKKITPREKSYFTVLAGFLGAFFEAYFPRQRLQMAYESMARVLLNGLKEKDSYTIGHSLRVEKLAVTIAKELGLPAKTINMISETSVMHDVGKISVDRAILNKPGRLEEKEWKVIKEHPAVGADILSPTIKYSSGLDLIRYHHERMDGSGYPDGLKGEEIPFSARILAVADAYDAMNSDRPYRNRLTPEHIQDELLRNAGRQFDCDVVDVMLRLV